MTVFNHDRAISQSPTPHIKATLRYFTELTSAPAPLYHIYMRSHDRHILQLNVSLSNIQDA